METEEVVRLLTNTSVISALVGAVAALLGTGILGWINSRLQTKRLLHEEASKGLDVRREQTERLFISVNGYIHDMLMLHIARWNVFEGKQTVHASAQHHIKAAEMRRRDLPHSESALMLIRLYFPQLNPDIDALRSCYFELSDLYNRLCNGEDINRLRVEYEKVYNESKPLETVILTKISDLMPTTDGH